MKRYGFIYFKRHVSRLYNKNIRCNQKFNMFCKDCGIDFSVQGIRVMVIGQKFRGQKVRIHFLIAGQKIRVHFFCRTKSPKIQNCLLNV